MPKCMPIDTNQHNPTKIIDGCQVSMEISTDKKTDVAKKSSYAICLNYERGSGIPSMCHLLAGAFTSGGSTLFSFIYVHGSAV